MRKYLRIPAAALGLLILLLALAGGTVSAEQAYTINGVTVRYSDFSTSHNECWTYAYNFYYKIWGRALNSNFYGSENLLRGRSKEELTLTPEHLKEYVSQAVPGAVLRISSSGCLYGSDSWGHSQIIVSIQEDGFTAFEGGLSAWPHSREHFYTWEEFCRTSWLGGRYGYIKYIKWPSASGKSEEPEEEEPSRPIIEEPSRPAVEQPEEPATLETMEVPILSTYEVGRGNNAADYVMLKRFVSGTIRLTETQQRDGDINGDGQVTELDLRLLKNQMYAERILPRFSVTGMANSLLHNLF